MEAVSRIRFLLFWLGLSLSTPLSAGDLLVFFDLDADPGSGCAVATSEGSFAGVERILITRYTDSMVTEVVRSECVDPPTDSFGPEQLVSLGGWPVGLALGSGGSDLVETFVELADLGNHAPSARIGFATRDASGAAADAMLGDAGAGFQLLLFTDDPAAIPSLHRLGLLLLALLLAALSLYGIRRHPGVHSLVLMVTLAGSLVGLVWAAVAPDGDPSDWDSVSPLGTDATGDGGDDDLVAVFAMVDGGRVCLRADLFWNQPPAIADQGFSIDENSPIGTPVGTLAASDPDVGDTLGFAVTGGSGNSAFAVDPANGEIRVADSAQLDFETNPSLTLDLVVTDGAGLQDTALVTIDLNDIDEPPAAVSDSATVGEDDPATNIDVLANDTDVDAGPKAIASVTQPANGTVVNNGTNLSYQPNANYCNDGAPTDDFSYTLTPGGSSTTVAVRVTCVDDAPVAVGDSAAVGEDVAATSINVLGNDTDIDAGLKTIASVTQPANGTVVNNGGDLSYQPDLDYCNDGTPTDDFTYTLNGGSTATVAVSVSCVDDAPVAVADSATVTEDAPATLIDVLGNDTDVDAGPIGISGVAQPANGTVVNNGTNVSYQPNADYCNDGAPTDDFTYTLSPGGASAAVAVTVDCVNDPPLGVDDPFWAASGAFEVIGVACTDCASPAILPAPRTLEVVLEANIAVAAGYGVGGLSATDFTGIGVSQSTSTALAIGDRLTITLTGSAEADPFGALFDLCEVAPASAADPCAAALNAVGLGFGARFAPAGPIGPTGFSTDQASAFTTANVLPNDVDVDGAALSVTGIDTTGTVGLVINNGDGSFTYDPNAQFDALGADETALDRFAYTVDDGSGGSDTALVSITVIGINDAPSFTDGGNDSVLEDAGAQTVAGWASAIDDGDGGNQTLTFNITANTDPGLFSAGPAVDPLSGDLTYTPAADANGSASITLTLSDDGGTADGGVDTSPAASFTISVTAVNDAPSFVAGADVSYTGSAAPQTVVGWATAISAGPADESGQTLSFNVTGNTNAALFSAGPAVDPVTGNLTYTPAVAANGTASIILDLSDDGGTANGGADTSAPATFTISISQANQEPTFTAGGDQTVLEDAGPQTAAAWATNIDDGDGGTQTLSFNTTGNTNPGLFSVQPAVNPGTGNLTFTPAANASGSAMVTVELMDDGGTANGGDDTSPPASFTINVTAQDDPPVTVDDTATVSEDSGASIIDVLANDTDVDAGPISISAVTQPANGTVMITGGGTGLTYAPDPNYCNDQAPASTDDFTYTLSPGSGTGSVAVTVSCVNDPPQVAGGPLAFAVTGNVRISVPAANGLVNSVTVTDTADGGTPAFTIGGTVPTSSAQGGDLSLSADGSFAYDPPAGFTGSDSFTYQVCDDGIPGSACSVGVTVNLTVSDRIWFIDNSQGAAGDGRLTSPFNTLAAFEAINGNGGATDPGSGDSIFVYTGSGNYAGGLTLEASQFLIGQGAGSTLSAVSGITLATYSDALPVTGGTSPVIVNAAGDGIGLATGNKLHGVNVGDTSGIGLDGSGFGSLEVRDMSILGTGRVLSLVNGSVDAVFTNLSTANATGAGISLDTVSGPFTANGGAIANASGVGVDLNALSGNFTFAGSIANNAGRAVEVTNSGGTPANSIEFSGALDEDGSGILLDNNDQNSGASITFRGGLLLDTGANTAFTATNGGTVNVCATADCAAGAGVVNAIGTTSALSKTAVNINGTSVGPNGVSFRSIDVDQGAGAGDTSAILLTSTGSGSFSVTGDGTAGSGGSIQNITDVDAIRLSNTGGRVSFNYVTIQDIAASTDAGDAIQTLSGVDGIHGENVNGGLTLNTTILRRFSDMAVNGSTLTGGLATNFNGLEIRNCTLEDANRFHVANRGDDNSEGLVRIQGLTGSVVVTDSLFQDGGRGLDVITPSTVGTLDATIQGNQFLNLYKEFASGSPRNVGGRGLSIQLEGSHDAVVRIGDPAESDLVLGNDFTNNMTASIVVLGNGGGGTPHNGNIDLVIHGSDILVDDHTTAQLPPGNLVFDHPQGGVSLNPGGGTYEAIVSGNTFSEVMNAAGGTGQLSLGLSGGAAEALVQGNSFIRPWNGPVAVRAEGNTSADVLFGGTALGDSNIYLDGLVGGPADDIGFASQSPFLPFQVNVRNDGVLDLTMDSEALPQHDNVFSIFDNSFEVEVQNQPGNDLDLYLVDNSGDYGYGLIQANGSFRLYRGASASSDPMTIIADNNNTGGGGNPTASPPTVNTFGTITATNTAPILPSITIP